MASLTPQQRPVLGSGARTLSSSGRSISYENRLSIIDEDSDRTYPPPPRVPPRAINRPLGRMFGLTISRKSRDAPPPYSEYEDVIGPKGEKFSDVRENRRYLSPKRRGGWKRLTIIAIILLSVIAGIVVGVVYGLHEKNQKANSNNNSTLPFPAGSWTFTTFLSTVSTACTANPDTWMCFPYETYNSSDTASMTTFNWIISASGFSDSNYFVSSSDNPFALTFTNATLQLIDSGLDTEAYTFSAPMDKVVKPRVALTDDDAATSCIYSGTNFEAKLYTKMQKTYPSDAELNSTMPGQILPVNTDPTFVPWPRAVEVSQMINGGANVPSCYKTINGDLGERVTKSLSAQPSTESCWCEYMNYGT